MFHPLKNQNGKGIILLAIVSVLAMLVLMANSANLADDVNFTTKSQEKNKIKAIHIFQKTFESIARNPEAWTLIVGKNTNMSCLATHTNCAAITTPQTLDLIEFSNFRFHSSLDGNLGFSTSAEPCLGYSAPNNSTCYFKPTITWKPICPTSPCIDPQIEIAVSISLKPQISGKIPINSADLKFSLTR